MVGRFFRKPEDSASVAADNVVVQKEVVAVSDDVQARSGLPDMVSERVNLHRYLLDKINLTILDSMDQAQLFEELRPMVRDYIRNNNYPLNAK